jgi:ABC-type uncharacterized transport system involved in gliding motility auxiliary subunit
MAVRESFRTVRWIRTLNLVLQAVLFTTLFGGLNYIARNHPSFRFDLTRHRSYSLSPETLSYVKNLSRPASIVVTTPKEDVAPEIRGLLDEYVHATEASATGRITLDYIDVYENRRRADELKVEQPNVIVLRSADRERGVPMTDLYRIKNQQREAFQGEQAITAALLDVSSPEQLHVYFLVGHGELQPDGTDARGLSKLTAELRARDFNVDTLELAVAREIPADANLLVAIGPQTAYTPAEQEMLRQYLSARAGRLILCLAAGNVSSSVVPRSLEDLLDDWGVLVDDDIVVDTSPEHVTDTGDLIIKGYDAEHPLVQSVFQNRIPLRFGLTRTVRPHPGRTLASGLTVVPVAGTSSTAWGETDYRRGRAARDARDIRPIPGIPPKDALGVVVASERVAVRDNLPFSVPGGRLVVFGTDDFIANARVGYFGNFPVFLGAVNWAVDRDPQLSVPARPIEKFQLALSAGDFMKLRYALLFGLPGGTLLLGLVVYWTRRQ